MPTKPKGKKYGYNRKNHAEISRKNMQVTIGRSSKSVNGPMWKTLGRDPFRPQYPCRLHYSETWDFSTGTAGVFGSEQIMRLNSLHDPNQSGAGHQPYGYDQLAALYRRYVVYACKFTVIMTDPSEDGMVLGVMMQPSAGVQTLATATVDACKERPFVVTRAINNSGKQVTTVTQYIDMYKIEGISKTQFEGDMYHYSTQISTSPAKTPFLRFAVASDQGTSGATAIIRCHMTFYCKFFERIAQSQSSS